MGKQVKAIPEGFHSVTPYLALQDAAPAIEFYKKAFGATEITRMNGPDGKVAHAEIKIGDSIILLGPAPPESGVRAPQSLNGSSVSILLYVPDADATFKQAVSAGAKSVQAVENQLWGDRYGRIADPFGHSWSLATHVEDVAPDEMRRRMQEATAKMAQRAHAGT